jgi:DNA-binding transcriptional LysR family regulator
MDSKRSDLIVALRPELDSGMVRPGPGFRVRALRTRNHLGHQGRVQDWEKRGSRLAVPCRERWIAFPVLPERREISASHIFALFQTHGLGDVDWTPVDSLTAQKRLVEAGFGIALLSQSNVTEELGSSVLSTIGVGDLAASQDIAAVTRRGGF